MSKFINLVNNTLNILNEADAPTPDAAPAAADVAAPIAPEAGGSALPPMGNTPTGEGGAASTEFDNKSKKDADPVAYTQSILELLVDKQEGISPEDFNNFVDNVNFAASKIKDKEGFKRFYKSFYDKVQNMLEVREELKDMYKQLQSNVGDLLSYPEEPNQGGGGKGMAGPSGPGVNK